ncbi:CpsD/CapB family tyrosine-protein kinase [Tardiphaga robiniae]|uniref:non-specific protein-tyrosine kinase n=2 Tax=Tardiphaga robiniae TaxID=943830 RepID=A0A7G6U8E8_9BRAD|nr:CpsD/CapB family tyrosine-protein kinase [Tardiphaga robiniae]
MRSASMRLNASHLEKMRIVGYAANSLTSRYYDVLRTQILQDMDKNGWQFLAITSPTPNCGKTVTACNLAMSVARLPEREVLLVDMDMHKAQVSEYLGINHSNNLLSVLEDRASLGDSCVEAKFGPESVSVLPGTPARDGAAEWMASQTMANVLQAIKREFRSGIVIFDLPPLLLGSDVLSILPRMDAVLLVTGVGTTTPNEIKECQKHLQRSHLVRVVVNKVSETSESYYGYGYS